MNKIRSLKLKDQNSLRYKYLYILGVLNGRAYTQRQMLFDNYKEWKDSIDLEYCFAFATQLLLTDQYRDIFST